MIRAMIFDLDGTLVKTERLKAISYAKAAVELCPYELQEKQVLEVFKQVVGHSRRYVAQTLVERFGLEEAALARREEFGVKSDWQAYIQVRLIYYQELITDPQTLRDNQWPHNRELLKKARQSGCQTALATMSRCNQAHRVLDALDLQGEFDFIATRDDVERSKPDPEIYNLISWELGRVAGECLVVEDSPSGVEAALAAGMWCLAVTTPFTREVIHEKGLLDERWVVDEPQKLLETVGRMMAERA